jgi:hypothetical protein
MYIFDKFQNGRINLQIEIKKYKKFRLPLIHGNHRGCANYGNSYQRRWI